MFKEINVLIDQFGGQRDVYTVCLFALSFFVICGLIKSKLFRIAISMLFGLFIILQIISLYFSQEFISYQFIVHLNLKGIDGIWTLYTTQIVASILLLLGTVTIFYHAPKILEWAFSPLRLEKSVVFNNFFATTIILLSSFLIATQGDFVSDTQNLLAVLNVKSKSEDFEELLTKNGLLSYVTPDKVQSQKGKNIIIISLESLEKDFLVEDKFSHLTPNLRKLKDDWTYIDMKQNSGGKWTSGSLYICLTGFPAFFGWERNSIFQNAYHSKISSISHALEKAGYYTVFLNGNANFSGVKDMLHSFHFDEIIDMNVTEPKNFDYSDYGVRDFDLFKLAKEAISDLSSQKEPFTLFISTTDTHPPDGIYDQRMEKFIPKQKTDFEFMVSAIDYLMEDFITFLRNKEILANTSVYIFPDHLIMGNPTIFDDTDKRGLYIITNASSDLISPHDSLNEVHQVDLPKVILDGAEITHNLKFLTDYITGDKELYIKENARQIMEINVNGLHRLETIPVKIENISEHYHSYKKDTLRYIAHAGGAIEGLYYTNSKEALDLSYEKGFRLFELDILKTKDNEYVAAHDWQHWIDVTGFAGDVPVTTDEFLKQKLHGKFTPLDMSAINEWFLEHKDAILVTDKINEPSAFAKKFIDPDRLMMELFDMDAVKEGLAVKIKSAMPSQNVISGLSARHIKDFEKMGIRNIAVSRQFISNNQALLKVYKKHNILPYAFHINDDEGEGIDEDYVIRYEMDYIYGIYADEWNFE